MKDIKVSANIEDSKMQPICPECGRTTMQKHINVT